MNESPQQPIPQPEEAAPPGFSKTRKELPVIFTPNDQETIEQEMAELFEEDKVSHQHGSAEPEGD
ncbi:MAG: hypothetical protein NNA18_02585 [Nitrospira sp.]|nr:hypothetical protein [Nitrospira sp.]